MVKFSVIIPVYNGERDIKRAVKSLQTQNYKNWELIIINDGSKDKTGEICDKLQETDDRIKVIHTINQGQGIARNIGISLAKGDYIWFVDADDIILPNSMELFMNLVAKGNYDIISALYYRKTKDKKSLILVKTSEGIVNPRGTQEEIDRFHKIKTESVFGYLWNKVYKREFLIQNNLQFDDIKRVYMEDQLFNLKAFGRNPSYYQSMEPVYCYYADAASTTRKADEQIAVKNREMLIEYEGWLRKNNILEENRDLLTALVARVLCWSLIKNMPYEGVSYKKIEERLLCFINQSSILTIIKHKECHKNLKLIKNFIQKNGYIVLFFMLRIGAYRMVALLFTMMAPFFYWYSKRTVK